MVNHIAFLVRQINKHLRLNKVYIILFGKALLENEKI